MKLATTADSSLSTWHALVADDDEDTRSLVSSAAHVLLEPLNLVRLVRVALTLLNRR